jgi:AcrR family transcriptional regulator
MAARSIDPVDSATLAPPKPKQTRDPVGTKRSIMKAAHREFCEHGYMGGRVETIAAKSKTNLRMIYHYFGSKERLYLAVLEAAYLRLRTLESRLDFKHASPVEAMRRLVRFTYDFLGSNPDVLAIISNENTLRGRFLEQLPSVREKTLPLIDSIADLLRRGHDQGVFRPGVDPLQFYVSLVALSQLHISNRFTLSIIFDKDLSDGQWLNDRRTCIEEILMAYLQDLGPKMPAAKGAAATRRSAARSPASAAAKPAPKRKATAAAAKQPQP